MFHERLTPEDAAVFLRASTRNRDSLPADYMVMLGDDADYRAMMAREVWAERMWRIHSIAVKPWMFASYETDKPGACRAEMERINGEPL